MKRGLFKYYIAITLLAGSLLPEVSSASVSFTLDTGPLTVRYILDEPPMVPTACLIEGSWGSCGDAPWVSWSIPLLTPGTPIAITTSSSDFSFFLGSELVGTYKLTLTPAYQIGFSPSFDELRANLAASDALIGATSGGGLIFSAAYGSRYYVMLSGLMRGADTYTLSVSAVPEPEQWAMLVLGLVTILPLSRRRNGARHQ